MEGADVRIPGILIYTNSRGNGFAPVWSLQCWGRGMLYTFPSIAVSPYRNSREHTYGSFGAPSYVMRYDSTRCPGGG